MMTEEFDTVNVSAGKQFMWDTFQHIAHGDDEHRKWLYTECMKMADELDKIFESRGKDVGVNLTGS